ncbi:MAG: flagellar motor switch protein FliG [Syntrophales bacterium]|jgi:flagellar motor switch protein FliG|nr:flagellar motor switch protein FliG [Syntrophales bacterium]MDY0043099.1 flagellar motor switch protein FliG [Syntrophales bacterium]
MNNQEKAAILVLALEENLAVEVLKNLSSDEVKRLGASMSRLHNISHEDVEAAARDFRTLAKEKGKGFLTVKNETIQKIIIKALGEEKAKKVLDIIEEETFRPHANPVIEKLRGMDSRMLMDFTKMEHPQTIALILAHLKPEQACEILSGYPLEKQTDILKRIATLKSVPQEFIEEMTKALESEIIIGAAGEEHFGGITMSAEILNRMSRSAEGAILDLLEKKNPELSAEIRHHMFSFDDIFKLDDKSIRELLQEVSSDDLSRALKVADPHLREKVFSNMSKRAAEMLKEDLEVLPPIRVSEIEQSQRNIIDIARKLESEGKVMIVRSQDEDEFV